MKMRIWMVILALVLLLPVVSIVACGDDDDDDDSSSSDDDDDDTVIDDDDDDDDDDTTDDDDDDDDTTTTTTTVETTTTTTTTIPALIDDNFDSDTVDEEPPSPWVVDTSAGSNVTISAWIAKAFGGNYCALDGGLGSGALLSQPLTIPGTATSLTLTVDAYFTAATDTFIGFGNEDGGDILPVVTYGRTGIGTKLKATAGNGSGGSKSTNCTGAQDTPLALTITVDLENDTVTVNDGEDCVVDATLINDGDAADIDTLFVSALAGTDNVWIDNVLVEVTE
ncbi:hypothetical protein KDL45_08445 [bacterium]|nr:hypothetical protein [bacterium]